MNTRLPYLESKFLGNCDFHLKPDLKRCYLEVWEHEGVFTLWVCFPREDFIHQDWHQWVDWVTWEARKQGFTKIRFIRADAAITKLKAKGRWSELTKKDPAKIKALLSVARPQRRRG